MDGPALFGDFPGYRGHVSLDGDSAVRGDPGNGFVFAADDPWDTRPGTAEPTSLVGGPPAAGQTGRVCAHVLPGPGVTGAEDRRLLGLRGKGRGHRKVRGAWWHVSAAEPALRGTGARPHRIPTKYAAPSGFPTRSGPPFLWKLSSSPKIGHTPEDQTLSVGSDVGLGQENRGYERMLSVPDAPHER